MEISEREALVRGVRFSIQESGSEAGRAFLYLPENDLHPGEVFGFMEDVYVDERLRGRGAGTQLVQRVIEAARERGAYKLIATSRFGRPEVHELYRRLGFRDWGIEFRMDFERASAAADRRAR